LTEKKAIMRFYFWALISLIALTLSSPVPDIGHKDLVKRETALNAFLAVLLDYLPAVDGTISSVIGVLTAFENLLAALTGVQITYNELGGACTKYTVIFARGTSEPGNVGILVGPPFFDALQPLVGASALTIQGVNDYSASIDGYLEGGDPVGSAEM
jgi:cutinase